MTGPWDTPWRRADVPYPCPFCDRRSWLRRTEDWLLHGWDFPAPTAVFAVLLPFLALVFAVLASGGH